MRRRFSTSLLRRGVGRRSRLPDGALAVAHVDLRPIDPDDDLDPAGEQGEDERDQGAPDPGRLGDDEVSRCQPACDEHQEDVHDDQDQAHRAQQEAAGQDQDDRPDERPDQRDEERHEQEREDRVGPEREGRPREPSSGERVRVVDVDQREEEEDDQDRQGVDDDLGDEPAHPGTSGLAGG